MPLAEHGTGHALVMAGAGTGVWVEEHGQKGVDYCDPPTTFRFYGSYNGLLSKNDDGNLNKVFTKGQRREDESLRERASCNP